MNDSSPKANEAKKRRRFSSDTANDLLFWGIHLCIVAISLGIIWLKVDSLTKAIRQILVAEERANTLLAQQLQNAEATTVIAQQAERQRSIQLTAATSVLDDVMRQVTETNKIVLAQSEATKTAALHSEQAAQNAAGAANQAAATAGNAAGAATRAAATSNRTGNVVASKVVTAADKRSLEAQERTLAAKQKQLAKTIRQVKKKGPTLWQQMFH